MQSDNLFAKEEKVIADAKALLSDSGDKKSKDDRSGFEKLLKEYRKLFKTTRRLMLLSDRNEQELLRLRSEAEKAKETLSRYFSPNLAKELTENPGFENLGGERRELTFLSTDLADFTELVEQFEPSVIVPLLNDYLDSMTEIVFRHGGTTDKIVGDALHVIFGAPANLADQAERALACALEIDKFSEEFREQKITEGLPLGVTRIGLHSGPATVGNFGGKLFFNYTAYGDAVNTAARLESVNRHLGTRICASAALVEKVPNFIGRPVGTLYLKGKAMGLDVFEPLTVAKAQSPAIGAYCAAFEKLKINDPTAKQDFAAVVAHHGEDPLAIYHLVRLLAGENGVAISFREK